jgi:hypothetical protein
MPHIFARAGSEQDLRTAIREYISMYIYKKRHRLRIEREAKEPQALYNQGRTTARDSSFELEDTPSLHAEALQEGPSRTQPAANETSSTEILAFLRSCKPSQEHLVSAMIECGVTDDTHLSALTEWNESSRQSLLGMVEYVDTEGVRRPLSSFEKCSILDGLVSLFY